MMLIADSGSTKTTWSLVNPSNGFAETLQTMGINPMYQDEHTIFELLNHEFTQSVPEAANIYFYGAGCINQHVNETVRSALSRFFHCHYLLVDTDLMAAARSLCQDKEGIACIMGTGSNSCYYDGCMIRNNISPLGYMLGDEGSGAVIGRKFIGDLLKNQLPENIREQFFKTHAITPSLIMDHVYKKHFPNRFLAQFTRFIGDHIHEPALNKIVKTSFIEFFERNIRQYPSAIHLPVNFVGGVAYFFRDLLQEAAIDSGYVLGEVALSPMEGLIQYHLRHNL